VLFPPSSASPLRHGVGRKRTKTPAAASLPPLKIKARQDQSVEGAQPRRRSIPGICGGQGRAAVSLPSIIFLPRGAVIKKREMEVAFLLLPPARPEAEHPAVGAPSPEPVSPG